MSGKLVTLALDFPLPMHPSRRLVLVALCDHANERDGCLTWPSNATLAKRTGLCSRQVREHEAGLRASGLIEVMSNSRGGRGRAKLHRINAAMMVYEVGKTDRKKAAAHCRVLRGIPGALPPGFSFENPAVAPLNPAVRSHKPGSLEHETRRPTATEPKALEPKALEPESFEPARTREASISNLPTKGQPRFIKTTSEPETDAERNARIEEKRQWSLRQVDAARGKS